MEKVKGSEYFLYTVYVSLVYACMFLSRQAEVMEVGVIRREVTWSLRLKDTLRTFPHELNTTLLTLHKRTLTQSLPGGAVVKGAVLQRQMPRPGGPWGDTQLAQRRAR